MNRNTTLLSILSLFMTFFCASGEKQVRQATEIREIQKPNQIRETFFSREPVEEEAFRVFVSSDEYTLKQSGYADQINVGDNQAEKSSTSEEINNFDLVDVFTEAIYRVEIYPDTGLISHIRPIKPAHISEINKIIVDDITRLKFNFMQKNKPEPTAFKVRYGVQLQKKKSQEEIRKILKEHVRQ